MYALAPVAPPAPHSAGGRAQGTGRTGRTAQPAGAKKPGTPPRPDQANSPAADSQAGEAGPHRGGSRRGRGPDADASQAERSRALLRSVVARLARRRRRRRAALRRGQDLAARSAPDDHDRRARADVLRRRAARPLGPGARPRTSPAGAGPVRPHAQTARSSRRAATWRSGPRHRSPGRRRCGVPTRDELEPVAR